MNPLTQIVLSLALLAATACDIALLKRSSKKQKSSSEKTLEFDQDLGLFQAKNVKPEFMSYGLESAQVFESSGKLIIWGRKIGGNFQSNSGSIYDPISNTWMLVGPAPIESESRALPIFTGKELILWDSASTSAEHRGAIYNIEDGNWQQITATGAPSPREMAQHLWSDKGLLVFGGRVQEKGNSKTSWLKEVFLYQPSDDRWMRLNDAPDGVLDTSLQAGAWANQSTKAAYFDLVLDFMTFSDSPQKNFQSFNLDSLTWNTLPEGPAVSSHGLRKAAAGRVLFWGGFGLEPESKEYGDRTGISIFDESAQNWSKLSYPAGLDSRQLLGAGAHGDLVFVFGGCEANAHGIAFANGCKVLHNDAFLVDLSTGKIKQVSASGPPEPQLKPQVEAFGEGFLVGNGRTSADLFAKSNHTGKLFYYDALLDTWSEINLPERYDSRIVSLDSDTVFIWGGKNSSGQAEESGVVLRLKR